MSKDIFPQSTPDLASARKKLAPHIHDAFTAFSESVFAEGALPTKTKQLIAVAAAHVTQCPYCIRGHTKAALRHGATAEEIMEAIWVAASRGRLCTFDSCPGYDRGSEDPAAEQAVSLPVALSTSIGDPDTHRQYSSLFKRLRGRRLQVQFNNGGLPQAE